MLPQVRYAVHKLTLDIRRYGVVCIRLYLFHSWANLFAQVENLKFSLETMFAVGLYDFNGTGDSNELNFKKDDVIELLSTDGDWLRARLEKRIGIVPRNYIKVLDDVKPKPQQLPRIPGPPAIDSSPISLGISTPTFTSTGIDVNVLQQFVTATANLNENQPIPANLMSTYPLVKEQYGKLNERVLGLQQEQNKLLELHSKMVHANQLYDQLMEYQMISKMNFSQ